ncbi:MAG: LGFP repeat-containing protein [Bauldia sp.]
MAIAETVGAATAATEAFITVLHALNGTRSAIIQFDNNTKLELRRIRDQLKHGVFHEPPDFVVPPGKSSIFSARDAAFSVGTGTEGSVTYVGAGYFITITWNVPFIGTNDASAVIVDDVGPRYDQRSIRGGGSEKAHMRFDVSARILEFNSIPEKVAGLAAHGVFLGLPVGLEQAAPDNYGRFQHFQNASIFWSPSTGAHMVHGAILKKYAQLGHQGYGYPFTDERSTLDTQGRFNHFQLVFPTQVMHGSIYWHPQLHPTDPMLAVHEVHGDIRAKWRENNWEQGFLGYPVTDEMPWGGAANGRTNEFQGGTIVWDPVNGARVVTI